MAKSTKQVVAVIKLQIAANKATPAPPVGPALGQAGVNIMEFCKQFNAQTSGPDRAGFKIPVEITVYKDKTFNFILKTPPAAELIRKAAKKDKGSATPGRVKVAILKKDAVKTIAELKMPDLNAVDIDGAMKIIEGTARSMGIDIK